jgi:hypothetical protein
LNAAPLVEHGDPADEVVVEREVAAGRWERVYANPATGLPWSREAALAYLALVERRGIGMRHRVTLPRPR